MPVRHSPTSAPCIDIFTLRYKSHGASARGCRSEQCRSIATSAAEKPMESSSVKTWVPKLLSQALEPNSRTFKATADKNLLGSLCSYGWMLLIKIVGRLIPRLITRPSRIRSKTISEPSSNLTRPGTFTSLCYISSTSRSSSSHSGM